MCGARSVGNGRPSWVPSPRNMVSVTPGSAGITNTANHCGMREPHKGGDTHGSRQPRDDAGPGCGLDEWSHRRTDYPPTSRGAPQHAAPQHGQHRNVFGMASPEVQTARGHATSLVR